jgi:predicted dehydrogenase
MVRLAIIGTGGMANAQVNEFRKAGGAEFVACCDVDQARAEAFAARHGFARAYTDAAKMAAGEKLDAVSIVTPNASHADLSVAMLRRKLHVLCEKPLAMNTAEARRMVGAARKAGTVNMVNFSYRTSGALEKARQLVQDGELGQLRHVEASYLQSWLCANVWGDWRKSPALLWRLNRKAGGSGTLGDLGCHILDFATRVAGDIAALDCHLTRFDKGVRGERLGGYQLDADDTVLITARFASGAVGTIRTTRWAAGHTNSICLGVYGDKGAIEIDLDRGYDVLRICLGDVARNHAAWTEIKVPSPGSNMARFLRAIERQEPVSPSFAEGWKIQCCLDACLRSDRTRRTVKLPAGKGA